MDRTSYILASLGKPASEFSGFPTRHPYVTNSDGSKSNVKLGTFGLADKTFVVPTMVNGQQLQGREPVTVAIQNGLQNYPSFKVESEADTWARVNHDKIGEDGKMKLGKITSYNYKGDPYTDSNSRNWIGSWGKISEIGMAVSPDVERQFRDVGIRPKDSVQLTLADGTEMVRIWDNRTMQDAQAIRKYGKPLTGRFDLHHPSGTGPHEKDGISVVGFKKYSAIQ